jgi:hypothetical protein
MLRRKQITTIREYNLAKGSDMLRRKQITTIHTYNLPKGSDMLRRKQIIETRPFNPRQLVALADSSHNLPEYNLTIDTLARAGRRDTIFDVVKCFEETGQPTRKDYWPSTTPTHIMPCLYYLAKYNLK